MGKQDKEYTWRMEGMTYALKVVKEKGVEALEKEIRMRGFFKLPIEVSQKEWDKILDFLVNNLHNTYKTVAAYTLRSTFGFGKKRLTDFEIDFDKNTRNATNFDYLGQHYATLGDYAQELNNEYGMHIDVMRVEMCQEVYKGEELKNMADVYELINVLRQGGYEDAAVFIEKKI